MGTNKTYKTLKNMMDDKQIILRMTQADFDETNALINRVMKMRESMRKRVCKTYIKEGKNITRENKRKRKPELNIVNESSSSEEETMTISLSEKDFIELKKMFDMVDKIRSRNRKEVISENMRRKKPIVHKELPKYTIVES